MDRGYLPLWRKIEDHPFYRERRVYSKFEAWLDILMQTRHNPEPVDIMFGMTTITCRYGELIRSKKSWARRWSWSESKVRRFFELLQRLNQIRTKSEGKTTRITVLNFEIYDPRRRNNGVITTRDRRATDARPATNKNDKNYKNKRIYSANLPDSQDENTSSIITKKKRVLSGKRLSVFLEFWEAFADKRGRADAADTWLDLPPMTNGTAGKIIEAAKKYAAGRKEIISRGGTPKMAQGWLASRRWEDEPQELETQTPKTFTAEEFNERFGQ